jgi:hypothetical protein
VRTDHHNAGERRSGSTQQYDPKTQHASVGRLWLLKPITGQAPSTAGTSDWAKESFMFNGIHTEYGAGRRVVFDGTRDLEGGHIF